MSVLIALMGAPGAGKSTLAKDLPGEVVSLDDFPHGSQYSAAMLSQKLRKVNRLLGEGQDVVFDSCLTQASLRKRLLDIAAQNCAEARLLYVFRPLAACLRVQASRREGRVTAAKVADLHARADEAYRLRVRAEAWDLVEEVVLEAMA